MNYPQLFAEMNKTISVTVSSGMTARGAALEMERAGVTDSAGLLVDAMVAMGIDKTLRPGVYELKAGTPAHVAMQIKNTKPLSIRLTLIPGFSFSDTAALVGGKDALLKALANEGLFPEELRVFLPAEARDRIIFLLPETYFLAHGGESAEQLVRRASGLWCERVGAVLPKSISRAELMKKGIIASIVEGEAKASNERPVLAGIFVKRLELGMRLQSCATVVYSWELNGKKKRELSYDDLKIESKYNTYLHDGLPPGPVCVPSYDSWKSALNPAETDYLFFFAGRDGRHIFSKTYKEHIHKQKTHSND